MMRVASRTALVAVLALTAACGGHSTAARAATPTVTVASVNGTGCPAGTVTTSVTGGTVTATYTAFTAKAGTGSVSGGNRRNCLFSLTVNAPGQTFAVTSATEQGAINLPAGATALQRTTYYLQGTSPNTVVDHPATGPVSGAWNQTDTAPYAAPCGTTRNLNINVELRVTSTGAAASLSLAGAAPNGTVINLGFTDCP